MRFQVVLVLASGLAAAAGKPSTANKTRYQSAFLEKNLAIVSQLPEACSLAACLNLAAQLTCIGNAIANGDPAALQKCLETSMSQTYTCVACFPTLNNILTALGACPVSAPVPTPPPDKDGESPEKQP